jgi:Cu/Ag efflux protein CusF
VTVEVRIGVQFAARELIVESNEDASAVESQIAQAVTAGGVLTLTDVKGKKVLVPAEKIAYVEIGTATLGTVGFRG